MARYTPHSQEPVSKKKETELEAKLRALSTEKVWVSAVRLVKSRRTGKSSVYVQLEGRDWVSPYMIKEMICLLSDKFSLRPISDKYIEFHFSDVVDKSGT